LSDIAPALNFKTARIVIAGIPRAGKTTIAEKLAKRELKVRHTDDLVGKMGWSESSAEVATWLSEPGPWIIEGVTAVRALRKWMAAAKGSPCDVVLWCRTPRVKLDKGQAALGKGCETVLAGILGDLALRGVAIIDSSEVDLSTWLQ
jgi:hypothetical protein